MEFHTERLLGGYSIEGLLPPQFRSAYPGHRHGYRTERRVRRMGSGRRPAELALRQDLDRSQRYFDTAEVILIALDLDGRLTLINRKGRDLLGRTEEELLGRDWIETCLPADTRDELRSKFANLVSGDVSIVQNPILTKSSEERLIEWHNTLLRDDKGCVIGTFSSGTDITERVATEIELKRLTEEIEIQRLRIFKATIRTVQDIVNNLLNSLQLVHLEGEGHLSPEILALVDRLIKDAAGKLQTLGDLQTIKEKEMTIGLGIDYPGSS